MSGRGAAGLPRSGTADGRPALRRRLEDHVGSRDVARVIYGAIVGLALVVALQDHPPAATTMAALLVGTAIAVGLAELYSEAVSAEARTRRPVTRAALVPIAVESVAVVVGAGFPAVFFVLSAVGVLELPLAFSLSKWSGFGLIGGYGFVAASLAGSPFLRAIGHGIAVGSIGAGLIALKALVH